jgi:hypothetical protein
VKRPVDPSELRTGDLFALSEHGAPYTLHGRQTSPSGIVITLRAMKDHFNHPVDVIVLRGEKEWVR